MNVQQGDLAMIISGPQYGLIVEVEYFIGLVPDSIADGPHWGVYSRKPVLCCSARSHVMAWSQNFVIPDSRLRPIAGERFGTDANDCLYLENETVH